MALIQHESHYHQTWDEYNECLRRQRAERGRDAFLVGLMIMVALVILGVYGEAMYGEWTCGMPGVHCRKVIAP